MNRRRFLQTMGLAALGVATGCVTGRTGITDNRLPNILFILADDLGWGDVHALNPASRIPTPNLDRLARGGISFTDAHAGSAACTPTRYGLLTGRHAFRNKASGGSVIMGFARPIIEPGRLTVQSMLKAHGYTTACFGKWNLGLNIATTNGKHPDNVWRPSNIDWTKPIASGPLAHGFDVFYGMAGSLDMAPYVWINGDRFEHPATELRKNWRGIPGWADPSFREEQALPEVTRRTVAYIESRKDKPEPFFVYMPLPAPHAPLVPLPEYKGRTSIGPHGDYCVELDDMVGKVMEALEKTGQAENTLVFFSSDNGFWRVLDAKGLEAKGHFPSGGFRGYKAEIHEGGHRVPFLVRWPQRIAPGRVCDEPVTLLDFMATCAEIVGAELPHDAAEDSFSLLPLLSGPPSEQPIHEILIHHSNDGSLAIRKGRWKLARCKGDGNHGFNGFPPGTKAKDLPPMQLFDMLLDPHETTNCYAKHPDIVQDLLKRLDVAVQSGRTRP